MTRFLIALAVVQTVVLAVLGVKMLAVDARTDQLAEAVLLDLPSRAQPARPAPDPIVSSGLTAEEVRRIVREEVASARGSPPAAHASADRSASAQPDISATDAARLKTEVRQDIEYFVGRGAIGEAEMVDLQEKIGRLPAADRREMLSRLTKALSSGKLRGQL